MKYECYSCVSNCKALDIWCISWSKLPDNPSMLFSPLHGTSGLNTRRSDWSIHPPFNKYYFSPCPDSSHHPLNSYDSVEAGLGSLFNGKSTFVGYLIQKVSL